MLTSLFGSFAVLASTVHGDAESTVMLQLADSSRMVPTDWNPNIMSYNIERDVFDTKRKSRNSKLDAVVTLTTQLSVDRVESMERQCLSWNGTCSAAVFVPEQIIPTDLFNTMEQMTKNVEAAGGCLIISVIHGIPGDDVDEYDAGYPINALRNLATDESTGDFVFALDVDFVASEYFLDRLRDYQDHGLSTTAKTAKPVALVIPAFWIPNEGPNKVADDERPDPSVSLPRDWPSLAKAHAELFKLSLRDVAHGPTDFPRWHEALLAGKKNTSDDWTYHVDFAEYFEPYVIVNKHLAPRYDERFRGYGFNKAEFLHHLNANEFDFQVLATDAFVLHGEHDKSESQNKYGNRLTDLRAQDENGKPLTQVGKVEVLWSSFKQELAPNFPRQHGYHADDANTHKDTSKE